MQTVYWSKLAWYRNRFMKQCMGPVTFKDFGEIFQLQWLAKNFQRSQTFVAVSKIMLCCQKVLARTLTWMLSWKGLPYCLLCQPRLHKMDKCPFPVRSVELAALKEVKYQKMYSDGCNNGASSGTFRRSGERNQKYCHWPSMRAAT